MILLIIGLSMLVGSFFTWIAMSRFYASKIMKLENSIQENYETKVDRDKAFADNKSKIDKINESITFTNDKQRLRDITMRELDIVTGMASINTEYEMETIYKEIDELEKEKLKVIKRLIDAGYNPSVTAMDPSDGALKTMTLTEYLAHQNKVNLKSQLKVIKNEEKEDTKELEDKLLKFNKSDKDLIQ